MQNNIYIIKATDERMCCLCKILGAENKKIAASCEMLSENDRAVFVLPPNVRLNAANIDGFRRNGAVFCGAVEDDVRGRISDDNIKVFEFLKYGQFVCKNAIITAKSALLYILKREKSEPPSNKVLVAGFGRVGRALVEVLRPFYGSVDILTTHPENAVFYGNPILKSECDFGAYDVVISTVPSRIFGEEELSAFKPEARLIELASKPYSFDTESADRLKLGYDILPSLPAKVMPYQAARIMYEFMEKKEVEI